MRTKKYLSIGEMAKLSGVHIKSLRYYDRIGVLKPAYVDPKTNHFITPFLLKIIPVKHIIIYPTVGESRGFLD